jgi:hypothetical protein
MPPTSNSKPLRVWWLTLMCLVLVTGIAAVRFRGWLAAAESNRVKIGSSVTLPAKGRGTALINFADGMTIPTEYSGKVKFSQSRPLSLAAGDFDGDGVEDLMSMRLPPADCSPCIAAMSGAFFPDPLRYNQHRFSLRRKLSLPWSPPISSWPETSTTQDAVTAKRHGDALNFFKGDGTGNLQAAGQISLDGKVTALASGDLNRSDGIEDLAVGITGGDGARALIFEGCNGALAAAPEVDGKLLEPESFVLPRPATAFAVVSLADNGFGDLAIAAGDELLIVQGRDRQLTSNKESRRETAAVISRHAYEAEIVALTTGRFSGGATSEVAVLTEDGLLNAVSRKPNADPDKSHSKAEPSRKQTKQNQKIEPNLDLVITRLEMTSSVQGRSLLSAAFPPTQRGTT